MSLLEYLDRKRYFLVFFAVVMLFVSITVGLSTHGEHPAGNLLYLNAGAVALAAVYIVAGYVHHRSFYRELTAIVANGSGTAVAGLVKPREYEQRLYLQLLETLHQHHVAELERLHTQRRDHQDFIMSWIHEVKLPITASRLLIKNNSDTPAAVVIDKVEDELNRIDTYVEQALYYTRVDSFANDYFIAEVTVKQLVKERVKKYAKLFISKRISVGLWDEEQLVYSDSKWLGFVVDQLVTNALKYTANGGTITFTCTETSTEKQLHIEDTGVGIAPEDLSRVFEKGFTRSSGRQQSKSTGMGLHLAQQVAMKLGHRLSIQSESGAYTRVTIHFPKHTTYGRS